MVDCVEGFNTSVFHLMVFILLPKWRGVQRLCICHIVSSHMDILYTPPTAPPNHARLGFSWLMP